MELLLGIDGGGTGTRAALATPDGCIQFLGTAGPSNPNYCGFDTALHNLRGAFDAALDGTRQSGHSKVRIRCAFAGIAGAANEANRARLHAALAAWPELTLATLGVDHDLRTACAGAHAGQPGIVVVAGTGSAAFGFNAAGESARAGGWGALVDDAGSASWLAIEALKAVVRAEDGRQPPTELSAALLPELGVSEISALGARLAAPDMTRDRLAALAPLVVETAIQGDGAANRVVAQGARELANLVSAIASKLFPHETFRVAMIGGTAKSDFYIQAFRRELTAVISRAVLEPALSEPVHGAILLAKSMR